MALYRSFGSKVASAQRVWALARRAAAPTRASFQPFFGPRFLADKRCQVCEGGRTHWRRYVRSFEMGDD